MQIDDLEYAQFKKRVRALTGIDLNLYKPDQMQRRLKSLMQRLGVASYTDYVSLLQSRPERLQEFKDFVTINVSEFYRDTRPFTQLKERVLPELLRVRPRLSVWSAGCSIGAEPYTVAMLLDEIAPRERHRILATDIDAKVLERARSGKGYAPQDVRSLPAEYLKRHFTINNGLYDLSDAIRAKIEFRQQNLLSDPFDTGFDLILCRNVVIYFTDEAKDMLYRKFQRALRPGGVLFVGGTEMVTRAADYGLEPVLTSFYRRAA